MSLNKIFVCHHKQDWTFQNDVIIPIQVGRAISQNVLPMIGDDTGDNISHKNRNFCELTAMYWAWKNIAADYIGFCHYRRYFCFSETLPGRMIKKPFAVLPLASADEASLERYKIGNIDTIGQYAEKFDIIVPDVIKMNLTIAGHYKSCHIPEQWNVLIHVLKSKYPEYSDLADKIFKHIKKLVPYNMFFMRFEIFHSYMTWLFDILFDVEAQITIPEDKYQARVFGFMAERLFTLYIAKLMEYNIFRIHSLRTVMPMFPETA